MQTKINPITLRHPAKAGHLKLFTVHLIDPNRRIMSTSMVPCQRRDWWGRDIRQKVPVLRRLPLEIFNHIIDVNKKTFLYTSITTFLFFFFFDKIVLS